MKRQVLLLVCATCTALAVRGAEWAGETADWMRFIPDRTPLAHIMMPGAHDAAMVEGYERKITILPKVFKGLFLNQDLTIGEQLAAGVRSFDLRPYVADGQVYACHCTYVDELKLNVGGAGESFRQIFGEAQAFLAANPSETAIFDFSKWSYGDDASGDAKTRAAVRTLMEEFGAIFYARSADGCPSVNALPLGDVRGKVIAVWDDTEPDVENGIWGKSGSPARAGCLATSGGWSDTLDLDYLKENQRQKWDAVRGVDPTEHAFLLAWQLTWQFDLLDIADSNRKLAAKANPLLGDFLAEGVAANGKAMIVNADYVSTDLSRQIIAYNFDGGEEPDPPTPVPPDPPTPSGEFRLYPEGDGGVFVPATKSSEQFLGTIIGEAGVEGTITVKMMKPNKKTGLFTLSATMVTLVDKQTYSFKEKNVSSFVDGPLTVTLGGTNTKSKAHTLKVTLEGDSLTGSFDEAAIDGAKNVFAISKHPKRDAILPFVGTWTGAFATHAVAGDVESMAFFSVKLTKSGAATVKVQLAGYTTLKYSAKAEVGADGVIAVPVLVSHNLKGVKGSVGFRVVFNRKPNGTTACEVTDVSPVRHGAEAVSVLELLAADELKMTSKEFKALSVKVDSALTEQLGPITKNGLKYASQTGFISGSLKWDGVSGEASGVVVGEVGFGMISAKIDGEAAEYEFMVVKNF